MNPVKPNKDDKKTPIFKASVALVAGLEMGASVALGYFIGNFLDKKFDSSPWLTIIFFILGVVAAFRLLFQRVKMVK